MVIKTTSSFNISVRAAQSIHLNNNLKFSKSYFAMEYSLNTPDQQITPDDDEELQDCLDCNGSGEIIEWDEDDVPETFKCLLCKGSGKVESYDN